MTISLPSSIKSLLLAALLVLRTIAIPLPDGDAKLEFPHPESESAPGGLAEDPSANSNNAFHLGQDIFVTVSPPGNSGTTQFSNTAVNTTLTALYKTFIEPSNAKVDPLNGPLNVSLNGATAGIVPTGFSTWGNEAPPPSFARLPYARWAKIVQGLQTFLGTHQFGDEVDFSVTRVVPGGGSEGVPEGAVVAKGFVRPDAG